MDPVSDHLIFSSSVVDQLRDEVKTLRHKIIMLKVGVCFFAILAIFNIWWYKQAGYKQGYIEAAKDFYQGTSLKCDVVNDKVVWIKK